MNFPGSQWKDITQDLAASYTMYALNACLTALLQTGHLLGSLNAVEHELQHTKWRQGKRIVSMSSLKQILHFLELISKDNLRSATSTSDGAMDLSVFFPKPFPPSMHGKTSITCWWLFSETVPSPIAYCNNLMDGSQPIVARTIAAARFTGFSPTTYPRTALTSLGCIGMLEVTRPKAKGQLLKNLVSWIFRGSPTHTQPAIFSLQNAHCTVSPGPTK